MVCMGNRLSLLPSVGAERIKDPNLTRSAFSQSCQRLVILRERGHQFVQMMTCRSDRIERTENSGRSADSIGQIGAGIDFVSIGAENGKGQCKTGMLP